MEGKQAGTACVEDCPLNANPPVGKSVLPP
jgi:hypothetical protein